MDKWCLLQELKNVSRTSSQDGGIGRYTFLLIQQQQKDKNKFKNKKITRTARKIELHGSLTTKEFKDETFIQTGRKDSVRQLRWRGHTARPGGDWQTWWGGSWWTRQSHICMWIYWEEQLGSKTDHAIQDSSMGK